MKKTVILFIFIFSILCLISQDFQLTWQECYGGSDTEYSKDLISTSDGYLILGTTKSNDGNISFNHGITDVWLFKIDFNGNILWEKTYGGSLGDNGERIFSAGQGNYYLLCTTRSVDGDITYNPYPGSWNNWIIKIDSSGNKIWDKVLGGSYDEVLWTGTLTSDDGVIACGSTASNDGDITDYYGLYDAWIVKVNSEGEKEWDFTIGTDGQDVAQAIIQTTDGGFLIGCASMIWDTGNITCDPYNEYAEAVLVKLDSNLNIEWNRCYGGSSNDGVTALVEVSDGYIFGGYVNSNDGDISGWHGEDDIWIVKVDFDGNIIWQKCLGGSRSEFIRILELTEDENILISGVTYSTDGDVTGNHTISEYEADIWLVKLSSEGELLWEHCFGGIWDEQTNYGFLQKENGTYVIAGQTDYGPSFDVACNTFYDPNFWVFEIKDTTVGLQEQKLSEDWHKVYPNPAKDYMVFEISKTDVVGTIRLINVFGEEIAKEKIIGGKTVFDLRGMENGIYFYKTEIEGEVLIGKIIIQK